MAAPDQPVFIVDDDPSLRVLVDRWLQLAGFDTTCFPTGEDCLEALAEEIPAAVLLDVNMPGQDGLKILELIRGHNPQLPVVMLTADDTVPNVVRAMKLGACDYLTKPLDRGKVLAALRAALDRQQTTPGSVTRKENVAPGKGYAGIVGISAPMQRVFRQLDRLAQSDVSVLIHGESGTGKELIARALHLSGLRSNGPFVAVNSAAIPDSLMESELFGHERGAFTGALNRRTGRFEEAHRGTLFFDEIGELSPAAQAKVLRVLQERKFERLGGTATVASDFRLITATHRNLAREVEENRFREDLYFRLAVYDLEIPPLRSRKEDIPELAAAFIQQHGRGEVEGISSAALNVMLNYAWPGNVRELQNAIMRALVVADGPLLQPEDLPERVRQARVAEPAPVPVVLGMEPEDAATDNALADDTLAGASRKLVLSALTRNGGNASAAMRELNIGRSRFYRMLKAFRLEDTVSQIRQTALPGER